MSLSLLSLSSLSLFSLSSLFPYGVYLSLSLSELSPDGLFLLFTSVPVYRTLTSVIFYQIDTYSSILARTVCAVVNVLAGERRQGQGRIPDAAFALKVTSLVGHGTRGLTELSRKTTALRDITEASNLLHYEKGNTRYLWKSNMWHLWIKQCVTPLKRSTWH